MKCSGKLIAIILLLCAPGMAQSLSPSQEQGIAIQLQKAIAEKRLPSVSIAIMRNGKLVYAKAFGMANVEARVPATTTTRYRIASISKPVTAVAAMQLVAQGKLDLDQPAQRYCPVFSKHPQITTRQLLSHRSGIPSYSNEAEAKNTWHYPTLNDAVRHVVTKPLKFAPGTGFQYGSYDFTVAGCVIEGASGLPYDAYVAQHILKPAGMMHTVVDSSGVPSDTKAVFYSLKGKSLVYAAKLDSSDRLPGGGWLSTPTDMVRFAWAVMSDKLESRASRMAMWTETTRRGEPMHYGLGWDIGFVAGHPRRGHGGAQAGTSTSLILIPDADLAVALFTNRDGAELGKLNSAIVEQLLVKPPRI